MAILNTLELGTRLVRMCLAAVTVSYIVICDFIEVLIISFLSLYDFTVNSITETA